MEGAGSKFTIAHFQQMLYVVPDFFLHRWDVKSDKAELYIDIPANIKEICARLASNQPVQVSNEPLIGTVSQETFAARKTMFRKQLVTLTYKTCIAYHIALGKQMAYDFKDWPAGFYEGLEELPAIPLTDLKPIPKVQKAESVSTYLQKFDIRNQMQ